jgi:hypothetical protein
MQTKSRLATKKVRGNGKTLNLDMLENWLHLSCAVSFRFQDQERGGLLLQKGKDSFGVVGFELVGVDPASFGPKLTNILDGFEDGLKDIPFGERYTFSLGSHRSDRERLAELMELRRTAPLEEVQLLLTSEAARIQELARLGVRKPKTMRVYCTIPLGGTSEEANGFTQQFLLQVQSLLSKVGGQAEEFEQKQVQKLLRRMYTSARASLRRLTERFKLKIRWLSSEEIWADQWRRLNNSPPPPIPQLLIMDKNGIREEMTVNVHATTLLLESRPILTQERIKIKGRHVAVLYFLSKPGGFTDEQNQLRYLWEAIARDDFYDVEVYTQVSPADEKLAKLALEQMYKSSNAAANYSKDRNSMDAVSELKVKEASSAQTLLAAGASALQTATIIVIHRDSEEDLAEACSAVSNYFRLPARVVRELDCPHEFWLQTLPICADRMLEKPCDCRQVYFSNEVSALLPIVCNRPVDSTGVEFLAEESGTPLFLNMFTTMPFRNMLLLGITRSGKSVVLSGLITTALALSIPVVVMDYPKPGGSSTFSDYTHFIAAAEYMDTGREYLNIFEPLDLRKLALSEEIISERLADYQMSIIATIKAMILGRDAIDATITGQIKNIVGLAISAFFADPAIQARSAAALRDGLGSPAWADSPCMPDFLRFFDPAFLDIDITDSTTKAALNYCRNRLKYWISSPVGSRLSKPSSVCSTAPLLVFALRNVTDLDDLAVLSLVNLGASMRRSMSAPTSLMILDEAAIYFESPEITEVIARLCVNGGKSGIHVIISSQTPGPIAKSKSGAKILENLNTKLIGIIAGNAIPSYMSIFQYEADQIAPNASDAFAPDNEQIYSRWILDDQDHRTRVRYYAPFLTLAAAANNQEEEFARQQIMSKYPDKYEGLAAFSRLLVASIRRRQTPDKLLSEFFPEHFPVAPKMSVSSDKLAS